MAILVQSKATLEQHRTGYELALCQRDYELVAEHHPDLLERIESAVQDGIAASQIKRWTMGVVSEQAIVQRCYNAARWFEAVQNG